MASPLLDLVVLCDRTAYLWWRTPPLVRMLAAASDPAEAAPFLDSARLAEAQDTLAADSRLVGMREAPGRGHPITSLAPALLMEEAERLIPSIDAPLDLLVPSLGQRRRSALVRPHTWSGELPNDAIRPLGGGIAVTSPAFTLLELAARLDRVALSMAVAEFVGTFSVYQAPEPIKGLLEELAGNRMLPRVGAWSPSFTDAGTLTDLWSRPPLTTSDDLLALARACPGVRGCRRLREAAELVCPGAASPFEVRAGLLLGWSPELGGEGLGGFVHNQRIELSAAARKLAKRNRCYCDLFWAGANGRRPLDLECRSRLHHNSSHSFVSDSDRSAALQHDGIDVVEATYAQIADERSFDALSSLVATKLSVARPERTPSFLNRRRELRAEVFGSWARIADY